MAFTVIGIERSRGEGTDDRSGKKFVWDNYNFHLVEIENSENPTNQLVNHGDFIGSKALIEKGAFVDFPVLPEIGEVYEIFYNKHGKLVKFVTVWNEGLRWLKDF